MVEIKGEQNMSNSNITNNSAEIRSNPFFILKVTCTDNRRTIVSASEEMSFLLDPEVCSEAQNALINPAKRLSAELGWFFDVDEDALENIRDCIEANRHIPTDSLTALSKFNATLYNFSISLESDYFEIGHAIQEIDEQYSKLDNTSIMKLLNQSRTQAKMATISEEDISLELCKKRETIRLIISGKLSPLDEDTYIKLVTMLAEKCTADESYEDKVILSDVVDLYEIRMQSKIEDATGKIEKHISNIKTLANNKAITENVQLLIEQAKIWDILVQPLQLRSKASGMPHEISKDLGYKLRGLALFLHNEKNESESALTLVVAMKDVFAELQDLSDVFSEDVDTLIHITESNKEAEEMLAEMESLQKLSEHIKIAPTSMSINNFITRLKALNARIKASSLDNNLKAKVRENLCYMAREAALYLHNEKHKTFFALTIAKALANEFVDMLSLRIKLNEDVTTLNQQAQQAQTQKSKNIGCLVAISIIVLIIIFAVIAIVGSSNSSNDSNSSRILELNEEISQLKTQISSTETQLTSMSSNISGLESDLNSLQTDLDSNKSQYYSTGNEYYRTQYNNAVSEYNSVYNEYSAATGKYNELYSEYKNAISDYDAKVAEYNRLIG